MVGYLADLQQCHGTVQEYTLDRVIVSSSPSPILILFLPPNILVIKGVLLISGVDLPVALLLVQVMTSIFVTTQTATALPSPISLTVTMMVLEKEQLLSLETRISLAKTLKCIPLNSML